MPCKLRFWIVGALLAAPALQAAEPARAEVVVVVDTSTSMSQPGMDRERTSMLVAKLLADIVPGELSVVRLLDLSKDSAWVPSINTGVTVPCTEDPSRTCHKVQPVGDWDALVRSNKYGALDRPARGDAGYKQQLNQHLAPIINNSMFGLAFRAAQGVFDSHPASGATRTVIWLSDGTTDDAARLNRVVEELKASGVNVEAVVFGKGTTAIATRMGLEARQVRSPADLMKAFANTFRRMVQAPYELDNLVAAQPTFEIKPKIDEAWVVVYGNDTLGAVTFDSPAGPRTADYAQDRWQGAGAYRVMYVKDPAAGKWTVHADGGGPGTAYAVVQRSSLMPVLIEPRTAGAGTPVALVAGIGAARNGPVLPGSELPGLVEMDVTYNGRTYQLRDDGSNGDPIAHDGRFTGMITFDSVGQAVVILHAKSDIFEKTVQEVIQITGVFQYIGGPVLLDLGTLTAGQQSCRDITLQARHQGKVPFVVRLPRNVPSGYDLFVRSSSGMLRTGGPPVQLGPGDALAVCLATTRRAGSSEAIGERWMDLAVSGSTNPNAVVPINLRWKVQGLSFWQLWGWLVLSILVLLLVLLWLYGYVKPRRFQRGLALVFVPDRDEVEEQSLQPIAQWKGVGIGWYRDARAFLHSNYRVSSKPHGAVASLHAVVGGTEVRPGAALSLYRETIDGEWEPVPPAGRRSGSEVFRVGDGGPYFKVSVRRT